MKRFTATEKWSKEWFQDLPCRLKCLWLYICDNVDAGGVIEPNLRLMSFQIGEKITESDLDEFGERIVRLKNGKLFIPSFISFQYGFLSAACKPHMKALESLTKAGIDYSQEQGLVIRSRKSHVTAKRREKVFERDGRKCVYCGSSGPLEPDHIVPCKSQGSDKIENLVTACFDCNSRKSDLSVEEFLSSNPRKEEIIGYLGTLSRYPTNGSVKEEEEEQEAETEEEEEGGGCKGEPKPEPPGFVEFWDAYPKKKGKGAARKAWRTLKCEKILPEILVAIRLAKASEDWNKDGGKWRPDPSTWLNQERWNDDPSTWSTGKRANGNTVGLEPHEMPRVWVPRGNRRDAV